MSQPGFNIEIDKLNWCENKNIKCSLSRQLQFTDLIKLFSTSL